MNLRDEISRMPGVREREVCIPIDKEFVIAICLLWRIYDDFISLSYYKIEILLFVLSEGRLIFNGVYIR